MNYKVLKMEDRTRKLILALKQNTCDNLDNSIRKEMRDYIGISNKEYSNDQLNNIAHETFVDFLKTADNPAFVVNTLLNNLKYTKEYINDKNYDDRLRKNIWITLKGVQVRNKESYVNGF